MPKILIVDDEAHIRLLLEQTLEEFEDKGVEIFSASDAKKALDIILKEKPDVVFLDIMMPEMNGYDVCLKIKNEYRLMKTFVILLTAKGQEADQKKGFACGANMYMTKPFDPDLVINKISDVLNISI
jgi:two-component system, OmpR family, alkaline phosphatase synthesis response regulator PhoP